MKKLGSFHAWQVLSRRGPDFTAVRCPSSYLAELFVLAPTKMTSCLIHFREVLQLWLFPRSLVVAILDLKSRKNTQKGEAIGCEQLFWAIPWKVRKTRLPARLLHRSREREKVKRIANNKQKRVLLPKS